MLMEVKVSDFNWTNIFSFIQGVVLAIVIFIMLGLVVILPIKFLTYLWGIL